jgi:hypothetical protein
LGTRLTTEVLIKSGNMPMERDRLIILVKAGKRMGRQLSRKETGIGSMSQKVSAYEVQRLHQQRQE